MQSVLHDFQIGSQTTTTFLQSPPASSTTTAAGLFFSFISSSALRDWLKFLVLGVIVDQLRQNITAWLNRFFGMFYVEVVSSEGDASYDWLRLWLTTHPSWKKSRLADILTLPTGIDEAVSITGTSRTYSTTKNDIFLVPSASAAWYHLWRGSQILAFQVSKNDSNESKRTVVRLRIYTLKGQDAVTELLAEAEAAYRKLDLSNVNIFRIAWSPWETTWTRICSKRARPLESVILDPGRLESLIDDLKLFMDSMEWYRQRGIPCRRGYLLHGPPGTGKTSLIAALAAHLQLDIYSLSLSSSKIDDEMLNKLLNRVPRRAILLIEDIDAAQHKLAQGRRGLPANSAAEGPSTKENSDNGDQKITLSGLLNALDGIDSTEGRILFVTSNHKDALDPALCRPGRMDVHVKFDMASKYQARELFKRFYPKPDIGPFGDVTSALAITSDSEGSSSSSVTPQANIASSKPFEGGSEIRSLLARAEDSEASPGSWSEMAVVSSDPDSDSEDFSALIVGRYHKMKDTRQACDIEALATRFAEMIPEKRFSMASLQEYLMWFRLDPEKACSEDEIRRFLWETFPQLPTEVDDNGAGLSLESGANGLRDREEVDRLTGSEERQTGLM